MNPATVTAYMRRETELASFSFQIFTTWGTKLDMEQRAAAVPRTLISRGDMRL